MGLGDWWERTVVPRIVRCGCATESIMALRRDVVPLAQGRVFELGCGGGINQALYDSARVTSYAGLDPSPQLLAYARAEAAKWGRDAAIHLGVGEAVPYPDASFDTVVCTFTLCSVTDHAQTLRELRRVLKPGGALLYAEHGRSPDAKVARVQERIDPLWRRLFGNCHVSRPVGEAIERSGFATRPIGRAYTQGGLRFAGWMEWGVATKV